MGEEPQYVIDKDGYIRSKQSNRIIGRIEGCCLYLYDRTTKTEIAFRLTDWAAYLEKEKGRR